MTDRPDPEFISRYLRSFSVVEPNFSSNTWRRQSVRSLLQREFMQRPRLLLADDHAETARLLRDLLQSDFDVIAEVPDGLALVAAAAGLSPDVVVTDISMPGLDGIAATAAILQRNPAARVVLVTVGGDPATVERGMAAGALGYVVKTHAGEELVAAVHAALRGECRVSRPFRCPVRPPAPKAQGH